MSNKKPLTLALLLATNVLLLTAALLAFELVLRAYHWDFSWKDLRLGGERGRELHGESPAAYDTVLGWVPRPGRFDWPGGWTSTIGPDGLRLDGSAAGASALLAVGDSFTFGDEVDDANTWPALLEVLLDRSVINAAVFGYGVDQMVLRAERLMAVYKPAMVLLAVIPDDIRRCELSYFHGWKPYFNVVGGQLSLENTPVPDERTRGRPAALPAPLGYSYLARGLLRRVAPDIWYSRPREHRKGEVVSALLLSRLAASARREGARLAVITLTGRWGSSYLSSLGPLVDQAAHLDVQVIDLAPELARMIEEADRSADSLLMPQGHLPRHMNAWVAEQIARNLRLDEAGALGRLVAPDSSETRSDPRGAFASPADRRGSGTQP